MTDDGLPVRRRDERIVFWIPKWHIETWIACLLGETVDETRPCKRRVNKPDYGMVAERFVTYYSAPSDSRPELPSLRVGLEETARLDV